MSENLETQVEEEVVETEEPQDIRDVIAAEFDKLEAKETEPSPARARDENGRFAPTEPVVAETQEPQPTRNPWHSWKKEAQTALGSLPPETQQMIQEREEQFHRGIEQYKSFANEGKRYSKIMAPYMDYLNQLQVTPDQAIPRLIETERVLRTADPQQRNQMFLQLAHDYGINVQDLTNTHFDPYRYQLEQRLAEQQAQLQTLSQSRQMAEEAAMSQSIDQFAAQHEHFEDVRELMADLLDRGFANTLDEAYAKAIRMNDDVYARTVQQQSPQQNTGLMRSQKAVQAAKAASVSVKGAPTGVTRQPEPKTTEDAVRAAFAAMGL